MADDIDRNVHLTVGKSNQITLVRSDHNKKNLRMCEIVFKIQEIKLVAMYSNKQKGKRDVCTQKMGKNYCLREYRAGVSENNH